MAEHNPNRGREDWQSQAFRSKIVTRLEDEMKKSGTQMSKSSIEMEKCLFQKAESKKEYLDLVARVLMSMTADHANRMQQQQSQGQNPGAGPAQGAQDPIGALQNLTGQAASGMDRQGMMQNMHHMGPGRPPQPIMQHQPQPHMQHQPPQMQQQPPQLTRQDAFMVTSPQAIPGSQGQPMVSQNAAMMYQAQGGGIIRSMGPANSMPHAYMQGGMPQGGMPMPSPVGGSPLTMMPSPHGVIPSPAARPYGVVSPSTNLHTPGTAVSDPCPAPPNTSQEELAYMEKLQKLSKYIEPLRKSLQDYEKKTDEDSIKNYNKITKLLDILSNPKKRVSYAVLEKCEQALMKQTVRQTSGGSSRPDEHMCQTLLNAVAQCSDASNLNHSLYRTFGPAVEAFKGSRIKAPSPPPIKKQKTDREEDSSSGGPVEELPDSLQGEIARLGRRFQVSVDSRHHPGSQAFHLLCRLEDPCLPSVPPLQVVILKSYPKTSPQCDPSSCSGYDATELFQNVKDNLSTHLSHMPNRYCLTQLLSSWEMSVRKACDPESPLLVQENPIYV